MITTLICVVFGLGYLAIVFEHETRINKAVPALLAGVLCWALYVLNTDQFLNDKRELEWFGSKPAANVESDLAETGTEVTVDPRRDEEDAPHLSHQELNKDYVLEYQVAHTVFEIASILFFLLGAMTIVEIVDAFDGFSLITNRIQASSKLRLLWMIGILTFFMSAVLDNLTTTIVMISLTKKLIADHKTRLFFAGLIVCASNAGGAWTVIGDVTTTMLWIKGKISVLEIMKEVFLPSMVCFLVPMTLISLRMRGEVERPAGTNGNRIHEANVPHFVRATMLVVALVGLLSVPIFKSWTHLPPFFGMMLSLGILWLVGEIFWRDFDEATQSRTQVLEILKRVDSSTILFFLGILLAIGALSQAGILSDLAKMISQYISDLGIVVVVIGLVSAVVDNVPLVAAAIEMYSFPTDASFWLFLAYTAGTGGSCLVIGSAAGVAAMGLEKMSFMWYLKNITPWALIGYLSGCAVYYFMFMERLS